MEKTAVSSKPSHKGIVSALDWIIHRVNEMDITEQLNWLGDASKPYQAQLELAALRTRLEAAEREREAAKPILTAMKKIIEKHAHRNVNGKLIKHGNYCVELEGGEIELFIAALHVEPK